MSRPTFMPALTGGRFVAAAVVVAYHFGPAPLSGAWNMGMAAVTFFFLLSGFVLTFVAQDKPLVARSFYVARFARIYPIYLVGLLLCVALAPGGVYQGTDGCAAPARLIGPDAVLIQSWWPTMASCLNGPAWSLSCEAFFYALFPLLLAVVRRVSLRSAGFLLVAAWALALGFALAYIVTKHAQMTTGLSSGGTLVMDLFFRHSSPLGRVPDFVAGMLLARLWLSGLPLPRPRHLLCAAGLWFVVVEGIIGGYAPVDDALIWPAIGVVLLVSAQGELLLCRVLAHPALVALGEASYGLYILHWPLHGILRAANLLPPGRDGWAAFGAYSLLCLSVSLLSLRYVESPARRFLRGYAVAKRHARSQQDDGCAGGTAAARYSLGRSV